MPLPIAHGLVGATFAAALHPAPWRKRAAPLFIAAAFALAPDLDFILAWGLHTQSWHRSFTHSLGFAALILLILVALFGRTRLREAFAYGLAFGSHALVDFAAARRSGGVQLLWPFERQRLKLGLYSLSELPFELTVPELIGTLLLEFALFAPPLAAVLLLRNRSGAHGAR